MDLEDLPASALRAVWGRTIDVKTEEGNEHGIVAERTEEVTRTSDGELTLHSTGPSLPNVFGLPLKHNQTSEPPGDAVIHVSRQKQQGCYTHGCKF